MSPALPGEYAELPDFMRELAAGDGAPQHQGNRTSKQGEQFGEIGFVPTRPFDFSAQ
jgi:hypothetical protein